MYYDVFVHLQKENYKQPKNSLKARVTHVNYKCNQGRPTQKIFKEHENKECQRNKKKRNINRGC